ncbi:MAG: divergent PAP2 family protein [Candidatus Merdivicinus sp.]|jgi:acid phosphatase family membrane protein YuiD
MDEFLKLFENYILWTALLSWAVAQALKVLVYIVKNRRFSFERVVGAGGMPSSHSATVCGLTAAVGRVCGLNSPLFAIAFILACVVMYDATGVRRAAGEQARVLNQLLEGQQTDPQKALKEFLGHTPLEVVSGAVLGIALAFLIPIR